MSTASEGLVISVVACVTAAGLLAMVAIDSRRRHRQIGWLQVAQVAIVAFVVAVALQVLLEAV